MSVGIEHELPAPKNVYRFGTFVLAIVVAVAALGGNPVGGDVSGRPRIVRDRNFPACRSA